MDSPFEGSLIRLRAREPEDEPPNHQWFNDSEITRWILVRYPSSHADQLIRLQESIIGHGAAQFAVEALDNGRFIGAVSLRADGPETRSASLGITIGDKACWDGGYGTDTMRTVCRFAFEMMNLNRIHLDVFPENERAIRCYEKVGFVIEGRTRDAIFKHGCYHDLILMSVLVSELK